MPAEFHAVAVRGDSIAEFVVVGKMIDQRLESSDSRQLLFRGGHYRAQHEIEITQQPRHQNTRRKIGAVAERFDLGREANRRLAPCKGK